MKRMLRHCGAALLAAALLTLAACTDPPETTAPGSTQSTAPSTSASTGPKTGWTEVGGKRYYLSRQGQAITGFFEISGETYYLDPAQGGAMVTGWITVDEQQYYLQENGVMYTGWLETEAGKQYLQADGALAIGWATIGEKRYHFNENGLMLTGWLAADGNTYYLHPDGHAATGKLEIEGVNHFFTSTGAEIIMVNPWNAIPEGYEVELDYFSNVGGGYIAAECMGALQKMWDACLEAGHRLSFCSGYRTHEYQTRIFNNWLNMLMGYGMSYEEAYNATKMEIAVPGTSEHQLGLAVDLTDYDYRGLDAQQAQTATQKWLMENCWDYGFILRYPEGSTEVTGIIYEPWHYRYVGLELAQEMKSLGITLEEYIEMLTEE